MDTLTPLEKAVLEKLLSGESEGYRILQKQICALRVTERKMTGVGFFTRFTLPDEAPRLPDEASLEISDVGADLNDLEHGAGTASHGLVMFVAFTCTTTVRRKENDPDWKSAGLTI